MLHHEVYYTLEKFQIKATIPNQRKNETIVTLIAQLKWV